MPAALRVVSRTVTAWLAYAPPYEWPAMRGFFRARAIDGIEHVDQVAGRDRYVRSFVHAGAPGSPGAPGTVEIVHVPGRARFAVTVRCADRTAVPAVLARIRRVLDLGADVAAIGAHLARDALLAPLVARRPGLRVPGGWDGFELAIRAVLGQQVTVEAARQLAGKLVRLCGGVVPAAHARLGVIRTFPGAADVAAADLSSLGMPNARKRTLHAIAEAALAEPRLFEPLATIEATVARLCAIRGVGAWTAHYIALRAAREPDAFPASDIGLLRGATGADGVRPSSDALAARAERWRPWRAYAAQHLWAADAER